jgi:carboxypeptidase PM20D1
MALTLASLAIPFLTMVLLAVMMARAIGAGKASAPGTLDRARLEQYAGAADRLAALIRIPTVSYYDPEREDEDAFEALASRLVDPYPLVKDRLLRTAVGGRAVLFEWPGSDGTLPPVILSAHYDVVPPGDVDSWSMPPFSGTIIGGYVHGRGSQDVKVTITGTLEAAEHLLAEGFVPMRTIFFAFGGDEETGGLRGASAIAAVLRGRGVRASFLLDEGGFVAERLIPFADRPLALVAVAEKGYIDIAIHADSMGGHASMPPRHTAAGLVAKAVILSESRVPPTRLTATIRRFLGDLSPYVSFGYRFLFRNLFITAPLVKAALAGSPATNALVRTTTAATMLSGSEKENVLLFKASAVLNVRVLPGSDVASNLARIETLASRSGARAEFAHHGHVFEPPPESPVDHEGYRRISRAIGTVFPESATVPFLLAAGTDSKHYIDLAEAVYRFAPIIQTREDLAGIHGKDERISIENVRRCCLFYETLLRGL